MRLIAKRVDIVYCACKGIVAVRQQHSIIIAFRQKLLLDGASFMGHFRFQIHLADQLESSSLVLDQG